jgi:hypothetical protein
MAPEHCDTLLGDLWDCDLEDDARRESVAELHELLEELIYDLVEG